MAEDPIPRHLATARDCLERLARDHRGVTATMAAYMGRATGNGIDPQGAVEWTAVEAAALRRIASDAGRYQNLIEAGCRALLEADTIRGLAVTANVNTTRVEAETRCDGWDDPTCEDNGVQTVWVDGVNHWLCHRCWTRQRVQKHRATSL